MLGIEVLQNSGDSDRVRQGMDVDVEGMAGVEKGAVTIRKPFLTLTVYAPAQ